MMKSHPTEVEGAPIDCRKCSSTNIHAASFTIVDDYEASRRVVCYDCHHLWLEVYKFSHTEVLEE